MVKVTLWFKIDILLFYYENGNKKSYSKCHHSGGFYIPLCFRSYEAKEKLNVFVLG